VLQVHKLRRDAGLLEVALVRLCGIGLALPHRRFSQASIRVLGERCPVRY